MWVQVQRMGSEIDSIVGGKKAPQSRESISFANLSSQILVNDLRQIKNQIVYYIPVYLRAKLKNIIQMDFQKLVAKVNLDFIMSVYVDGLEPQQIDCLEHNLVLVFPRDPPLHLSDELLVTKKPLKDGCLEFTITKIIEAEIINDIYLAPFQKAHIIISANLRKLHHMVKVPGPDPAQEKWIIPGAQKGPRVKYKFNFMQARGEQFHELRFSSGTQREFGFYYIAQKKMEVIFDNVYQNVLDEDFLKNMKNIIKGRSQNFSSNFHQLTDQDYLDEDFPFCKALQQQGQLQNQSRLQNMRDKIDAFQYAYFIVPLYKSPYSMTALLLLQLALIGSVNIGIFFQDITLSGKMMLNMAALIVSLIAILPNIRQSMGKSSQITLAEGCIIFQTSTIILTFIRMIRNIQNQKNQDYLLGEEGFAIACIVITAMIALVLVLFLLWHLFYERRSYHFDHKKHQVDFFQRKFWKNQKCDRQFLESVDFYQGRVFVLKAPGKPAQVQKKNDE